LSLNPGDFESFNEALCASEVLWSWCNFKLTSSGFVFHVAESGIVPDVEFVFIYISMRNLELLHSGVSQIVKKVSLGEIITSCRERKPQEPYEKDTSSLSIAQQPAEPGSGISLPN
jgi:hypothetical protein